MTQGTMGILVALCFIVFTCIFVYTGITTFVAAHLARKTVSTIIFSLLIMTCFRSENFSFKTRYGVISHVNSEVLDNILIY